ncbi:MAG: sigma-70 family RNA polymerase sigma factor [Bacteroidetes bacterium]|nr:sigma-70 family RNA polymerase sigma factor [Bacteroidota bacterium]
MNEELNILIKGCIAYDRISQEKLYRQFYPDLLVLCSKFFDDEHDIITAMNNGMLQVFNNIEKYNPQKGGLYAWIYVIVRNAAISHLRHQKIQPQSQQLTHEVQLESSSNPLQPYNEEIVYTFLKTLTITTRAVFNLFYIEGFLIKEIAYKLNMKEGTVKWHLNDGRNKLRTHFANNKHLFYANE